MKMKMKKYRKMSSILEFSISKLGHIELFIKISEKRSFLKFLPAKDMGKGVLERVNLLKHNWILM